MNKDPRIDFDELAVALRAPGARAPLVVWMIEHHDELASMLARTRVNWASFCAYIDKQGFRNARGEPLIPDTVRQCWKRARAAVSREKKAAARRRLSDGIVTRSSAEADRVPRSLGVGGTNGSGVEPVPRARPARPIAIEPEFDPGEQNTDLELRPVPAQLRGWQPPSAEAAAAREVAEMAQQAAKPKRAKDAPNG
ncbi:MAG: hypothetical protein ACREFP_11700 [Acetobacteraceae bacterium]